MGDLFESANGSQHREDGFDDHALVPVSLGADFQVGRIAFLGVEPGVAQDNHLLFHPFNQWMERGVGDIGRVTVPADNQPELIEHEAQLAADDPAQVRESLFPNLLGAPPFPTGVDQFNPVAVNHPEHGGPGQQTIRQVTVGVEQTKQAGPVGELGETARPISDQPTIESAIAHSLDSE